MGNGEFPVSIILKALDRATAPLAAMGKPFEAFGSTLKTLNNSFAAHSLKMESYTKGFKAAGEALESAGLRMTIGITAPIVAFRHQVISAASDFESAMNRVEAATGATGDELKGLKDLAREVGKTTTFSATEAGQAMGLLAREGMSTRDIMAKLPSVTNLAAASHLELGQAASAVSEILNGYNVPAEKSSAAIDMIARASQMTRGGLESFGDAMAHVGPISAAMNIPLSDTVAVVAAMSQAGFVGGRAGSALAKGISSVINPSESAARALFRLKINPWDVMDKDRNLKSVVGLLELLKSRGASASDILQIFGTKGGIAFQAVLAKGIPSLRALEKQLKESAGAAEKLGAIQEKGLNADLKRLSNAFSGLGVAIGESGALGSLAKFVEKGIEALNWLGEAHPAFLKWGFIILGVVGTLGPLLGYMGMMVTGIAVLLPFLAMLASGLTWIAGMVAVMGAPIIVITLAIAALAAGAYLVWKNWAPIKKFFIDLWETVESKFLDTWATIKEKIGIFRYLIPGAGVFELASRALAPADKAASATGALPSNVIPFPPGGRDFFTPNASFAPPNSSSARDILPGSRNETHLLVEFENMPKGTRVKTKRADAPLDLTRGYAMENGS